MRLRPPFLKRIDTYIIGKFLGTYFFSILLIISVAVVFDYNDKIDKFTQSGAQTTISTSCLITQTCSHRFLSSSRSYSSPQSLQAIARLLL